MADLTEIRAKAAAHSRALDAKFRFLTVQDLAARWGCSESTVRDIPLTALPYTTVGRGKIRPHRRYNPEHVAAHELRLAREEAARAGLPAPTAALPDIKRAG